MYAVCVEGFAQGFAAAERLSSRTGATLRWAAMWLDPSEPIDGGESTDVGGESTEGESTDVGANRLKSLVSPTAAEVRDLIACAAHRAVIVHYSPATYVGEEGPDAPWISFVDAAGHVRDDARVYRIELAGNAVPLTTLGDRPSDPGFAYGPREASGWDLRFVVVRDHMPRAELVRWLAEGMGMPPGSIRHVTG